MSKPETFFTSDTHFFHEKILDMRNALRVARGGRAWECVEDMHETIVERWNAVVRPTDVVYHIGDVTFKPKVRAAEFEQLWSRLNGVKYLNPGNHDECVHMSRFFRKIEYWNVFATSGFFTSHVPLPLSEFRDTPFQLHGHTHQPDPVDEARGMNYVCACVEAWDFRPAHISEIRDIIRRYA